mmetsp:Transcript_36949/g.59386  ORF Transcript_36949/g.59386 Transcript_36949/m.59386 type:complete len:170 (+) Transcript_36949:79-588(+)|eukprot:CAMPEP_0181393024 /NCGR_PEP_ID=MMETSP1106-20121128/26940_1 /TAXON_ID=81844 /ORGANISM="Mantoniella antarctica, Strain SL-175" /LENGTH=169 /DNA_ID=CAMNT_0023514259 /DNA_START=393 /DNA_END=902 /DNA_ORIENTATION=-
MLPAGAALAPPTRRAISLMRRMLRISRDWAGEGGIAEAEYIIIETSRGFRERQHLTDAAEIARALDHAEERLEIAQHYAIAYPRMPHVVGSGGGDVKSVLPPAPKGSAETTWAVHVGSQHVPPEYARMAAAARPVNPRLDAARAAARQKRLAMSNATPAATPGNDESEG